LDGEPIIYSEHKTLAQASKEKEETAKYLLALEMVKTIERASEAK
jgi:hypothetical protein